MRAGELPHRVVFGARRLDHGGLTPTASRPARIARSCATDGAVIIMPSRLKQSDARERPTRVRCAGQISSLQKPVCLVSARPKHHARITSSCQSNARPPTVEPVGTANSRRRGDGRVRVRLFSRGKERPVAVLLDEMTSEAIEDSLDALQN